MRIGFYIHHTTISAGGIFTYSIGILKQLLKSDQIEKLIIITSNEVNEKLNEISAHPKVEIANINRNDPVVKLRLTCYFALLILSTPFRSIFYRLFNWINPYSKILKEQNLSLFHIPVQYSPIYRTKIPVIITMHDLQEYHFPEFFSFWEKLFRKINNKMAILDSDRIIVSFKHVKNDILKYFKVSEEKVSVCPPPFADNWFAETKETDWSTISKKYNLKKDFMLYPAATWQHKNHLGLIQAMKNLVLEKKDIHLVCTGKQTEFYQEIQSKILDYDLTKNVHFPGIVPEEDLIGLYKSANLVVIPTLYEAGSGPLYEAMRYGIPVICSNVTSLPETIGNNDFIFNPSDSDEILKNKTQKKRWISSDKLIFMIILSKPTTKY
ncbi:MAG: glycosyltransferase family 1 protein [Ignavibacteriaceae bacterium]